MLPLKLNKRVFSFFVDEYLFNDKPDMIIQIVYIFKQYISYLFDFQ